MAQVDSDDDRKVSKEIIHWLIFKKYLINNSDKTLECQKLKKSQNQQFLFR